MLVLSRKENETIEFPALGVVIRVFGLTRKRVQLGIEAPVSLKVTRGEKTRAGDSALPPAEAVDSIAEHVIAEQFGRLESELAALAELATTKDLSSARQIAADAAERMLRIQRTVAASLRRHEAAVLDDLQQAPAKGSEWSCAKDRAPASPCVRQSPADYAVCVV